jgi:hypothetical protein
MANSRSAQPNSAQPTPHSLYALLYPAPNPVHPAPGAPFSLLQSRVLHGVRQEILALSEIPFVKSHTARLLYKAGLRTPDAVAAVTSVDQIVAILSSGAPPGWVVVGSICVGASYPAGCDYRVCLYCAMFNIQQ